MMQALFGALMTSTTPAASSIDRIEIPSALRQGQLVIGHAPHGTRVEFNGRQLHIGDDGVFVFGLDREAPAQISLLAQFSDGKSETVTASVTKREYQIERIGGCRRKP